MILTGKAKEDFINWKNKNYENEYYCTFSSMPKQSQNALIIEWFDSVGIYISILTQENDRKERRFTSDINEQEFISCKTRQQATEESIKKANEIYNKN